MNTQNYIKQFATAILFIAFAFNATAENLLNELSGLNNQWAKTTNNAEVDPLLLSQNFVFDDNEDLIQLHLQLVENTLRNRNTEHLTITQQINRELGLNILRDYWQNGLFPKNTNHTYRIPYFIDAYNTACAVGHIMRESGSVDLATTVANTVNNAYIAEMPYQNELQNWANQMGFTVEELKWIQPTYGPAVILQADITGATCGNSDGGISLTVTSGDIMIDPEMLVLEWNNMAQGTEITGLEVGQYCVNVYGDWGTGELSWLHTECYTVGNSDGPQIISSTIINESCADSSDGSITIEIDDSNATIVWIDDINNETIQSNNGDLTINNLNGSPIYGGWTMQPQTYTAQITNEEGCVTYQTFTVEQSSNLNAYVLSVQDSYCWDGLGSATIYVNNPIAEIVWSNGAIGASVENLNAGTYTVSVIDQYGCIIELSIVIALTDCPPPDCEFDEPLWLTEQLNNPQQLINECICSIDKFFNQTTYQYYYFFDSNCNEVDAPDTFYDCDGNIVCMTNGEISPNEECGADFTEGLIFHYNIFNCDNNNFLNAEDDLVNTTQAITDIAILFNDTYDIGNTFPLEGTVWNWFMQVGGFAGTQDVITDDITITFNNGIADLTADGISFPIPYTVDLNTNQIVFDDIITTVLPVSNTFYYYIEGLNLVLVDNVDDGYNLFFIASTDLTVNILTQPEIGEVTLNSNYTVTYTYTENMVPQNQSFTYEICTNILGAPFPLCDEATVFINQNIDCNLESLVGYNITDYIGTDDIPQSYMAAMYCFKDSINSDADFIDNYVWTLIQNNEIIETSFGPVWCDVTVPLIENVEPVTDEYSVCLTITDPNGCSAFSCIDLPNPFINVIANDDYVFTETNQENSFEVLNNDIWSDIISGSNPEVSLNIINSTPYGASSVSTIPTCFGPFCLQINYIALPNFTGTDELVYELCINGICDSAVVYITVFGNSEVIDAVDDNIECETDSVSFNILSNDYYGIQPSLPLEGTIWHLAQLTGGFAGIDQVVTGQNYFTVEFTSNEAFFTQEDMVFVSGYEINANGFISFDSENPLFPVSSTLPFTLDNNQLIFWDGFVDGYNYHFVPANNLSISLIEEPQNGTVDIFPNLNIEYTPNSDLGEADLFTYELCFSNDGTIIACDIATVYINSEICVNDCVWPGDANADGFVNNFDLLAIGLAYYENGEPRENASINWTPQTANNWATEINSPSNIGTQTITINSKHSDCDGSGEVNENDITAIDQNYGLSHGKTQGTHTPSASAPYLNIDILGDVFAAGSTVSANINLTGQYGDGDNIENVYGVAFTINYHNMVNDVPLIVQETVTLNYDESWLGNEFNTHSLTKDFAGDAYLETAYTRFDHQAFSGSGKLASMSFVIEENVAGKKADYYPLEISIENAFIIDAQGTLTPINTGSATIDVVTSNTTPILNEQVNIYPIPAQTEININVKDLELKHIDIYDISGKLIDAYDYSHSLVIEEVIYVENLPSGLYFLRLETTEGILTQKVEIIK